jgi:hypothetical protein
MPPLTAQAVAFTVSSTERHCEAPVANYASSDAIATTVAKVVEQDGRVRALSIVTNLW